MKNVLCVKSKRYAQNEHIPGETDSSNNNVGFGMSGITKGIDTATLILGSVQQLRRRNLHDNSRMGSFTQRVNIWYISGERVEQYYLWKKRSEIREKTDKQPLPWGKPIATTTGDKTTRIFQRQEIYGSPQPFRKKMFYPQTNSLKT